MRILTRAGVVWSDEDMQAINISLDELEDRDWYKMAKRGTVTTDGDYFLIELRSASYFFPCELPDDHEAFTRFCEENDIEVIEITNDELFRRALGFDPS